MADENIQSQVPNANFYKYHSSIFVVTKREMHRMFLWLYKGNPQYFGEYLKTLNGGMKRIGRHERVLLDKKESVVKFDIPFLYVLFQRTCDLSREDDEVWNKPKGNQKESLEHTLYRLKEIRNYLSHKPEEFMFISGDQLDNLLDKLLLLIGRALTLSGEMAGKPDDAANCITKLEEDLKEIRTNTIPSGFTPQDFAVLGRKELERMMPLSNHEFAELVFRTPPGPSALPVPLLLTDLLQWECEDRTMPDVVLVSGDTGTGKSSLCR